MSFAACTRCFARPSGVVRAVRLGDPAGLRSALEGAHDLCLFGVRAARRAGVDALPGTMAIGRLRRRRGRPSPVWEEVTAASGPPSGAGRVVPRVAGAGAGAFFSGIAVSSSCGSRTTARTPP